MSTKSKNADQIPNSLIVDANWGNFDIFNDKMWGSSFAKFHEPDLKECGRAISKGTKEIFNHSYSCVDAIEATIYALQDYRYYEGQLDHFDTDEPCMEACKILEILKTRGLKACIYECESLFPQRISYNDFRPGEPRDKCLITFSLASIMYAVRITGNVIHREQHKNTRHSSINPNGIYHSNLLRSISAMRQMIESYNISAIWAFGTAFQGQPIPYSIATGSNVLEDSSKENTHKDINDPFKRNTSQWIYASKSLMLQTLAWSYLDGSSKNKNQTSDRISHFPMPTKYYGLSNDYLHTPPSMPNLIDEAPICEIPLFYLPIRNYKYGYKSQGMSCIEPDVHGYYALHNLIIDLIKQANTK